MARMYQFTTWATGAGFGFTRKLDDITDKTTLATISSLQWQTSDQQ